MIAKYFDVDVRELLVSTKQIKLNYENNSRTGKIL